MNFRSYEIKDICKIKSGKRLPKGTDFSEKPTKYKYIRARDIKNGKIDGSDLGYISEEIHKKIAHYIVNTNDIIITIAGTIGEVALVSKEFDGVNLTENAVRLTEFSKDVCPGFLAYILKSPERKEYMEQVAGGSAQPKLGIYKIEAIKVDLPDTQIQHKIADILSAYDDLIENNEKQIKLLEEAAQRLYKEWFVDLRFPGHENTKIVDGVPEGWSKSTVGNICKLRKVVITPDKIESNTPYIGLEHMPRNDICLSTWGKSEEINSNKFIYLKKDVLFGKIRPYFHKVGFALNDGITSTDTMVMVADQNLWGLLLVTVSSDAFVDFSYQNCKEGAKMPRADWKQMEKYTIMIADQATQKLFEQEILVITNKISALAFQCRSLREARDRMLPKLMGGEVEA